MKIIELAPLDNGAHSNQTSSDVIPVPDGWAVIPDDLPIPDTFPFVDVVAEDGIVTALTPGQVPPPAPDPETPPTDMDRMAAAYQEGVQGA